FCGMHFFNPVPASKLVEIVVGERTGQDMQDLTAQWVAGLGKTPVTVKDAPGFASSRLGVALGLEAIRMVEEGVASPEDIDNAM
ncbi:3-hydroxyacyl-CoA dehydrogenase NAD-binding domain-containing protein, partial [Escherichia coli]|nr:3-hydroxyacyl-CoA dehydrogenase NAD-binding domain-containing protein [Escherichia coli]